MKSDEDVAEGIARMIRALGRRCAAGDPDTARLLEHIQINLGLEWARCVGAWREQGFSDAQIGRELGGITKQAVQKRWPRERATA